MSKKPALTLRIAGILLTALLGALFGVLPSSLLIASLMVAGLMMATLADIRPPAGSVALWALFAGLSKLLTSWSIVIALVVLGLGTLALLALILWGVPKLVKVVRSPRAVLAGTRAPWLSLEDVPLRGQLRSHGRHTIQHAWALFDMDGKLLAHGTNASSWKLDLGDEQIPLEGQLALGLRAPLRTLEAEEAHARLGISRHIQLPERVRLVERHLRPGDEVKVSGEIVTETAAAGYRNVAFSRRLVGKPGHPLVLR